MIFMEENIVKKVIKEKSYNVICASKNCGDKLTNVQEYLKEYFGNYEYLNYANLYKVLIDIAIDVFDSNQIKNLLYIDIPEYYSRKQFLNNLKNCSLDYKDLCDIIITKLTLLQMREKVNNKYIDLYMIDINGKIVSYDQYEDNVKIKSKK